MFRRPSLLPTSVAALTALTLPAAASATVTSAPVADTYVTSDVPTHTAGTSPSLRADASPVVRSYLRFDAGAIGTVHSATLRLTPAVSHRVGLTLVDVADDSWNELTTDYNSAPA